MDCAPSSTKAICDAFGAGFSETERFTTPAGRLPAAQDAHDHALSAIAQLAADLLGATDAAVIQFEPEPALLAAAGTGILNPPAAMHPLPGLAAGAVVVVPDVAADARFALHPLAVRSSQVRSLAAVPLVGLNNAVLGMIIVAADVPRPDDLSDAQKRMLANLASQVVAHLAAERERRLYADALNQSEQNYNAAVELGWRSSWTATPEGTIDTVGPHWLRALGLTLENIRNDGWVDRVHPDDRQAVLDEWARSLATGAEYKIEFRIRHHDGEYCWYRMRAAAQRDLQGKILRWFGAGIDITEQKIAELALQESEDHFRSLVELSPQIPWTSAHLGGVLDFGPRWGELTGQSTAESLGSGWVKVVHPEDFPAVRAAVMHAWQTGQSIDMEYRARMQDGSFRWMRSRGNPRRDADGNIVRWYGFAEDIHEYKLVIAALRESEEYRRHIYEMTPQVSWVAGADGRVVEMSPRWTELTGQSVDEAMGDGWQEFIHPDQVDTVVTLWREHLRTGEPVDGRWLQRTADGAYRWFRVRVRPRRDEAGQIMRWYGVMEDIHDLKVALDKLRANERQLKTVFEQTMVGILHRDFNDRLIMANDRVCELLGRSREELNGLPMEAFTLPEDWRENRRLLLKHRKNAEPFNLERQYVRPDGTTLWVALTISFVRNGDGKPTSIIAFVQDISARKHAEAELRNGEELLRLATRAAGLGVMDYHAATGQIRWSGKFKTIVGAPADVVPTIDLMLDIVVPEDRAIVKGYFDDPESAIWGPDDARRIRVRRMSDGAERWLETYVWHGTSEAKCGTRLVITAKDVTDEKNAEDRIRWAAEHDALTGLANRRLFKERLEAEIADADMKQRRTGLLLFDVDKLKQTNDTLGHEAGDVLLRTFAQRLRASVRESDTVARLGGDEFAIILPDLRDDVDLSVLSENILSRLREPVQFGGRMLECRASIGASVFPDHGRDATSLQRNADVALYRAKSQGRGKVVFFQPEMRSELQLQSSMLDMARNALRADQIMPFYQPKIALSTGKLDGFEALLRWNHPRQGIQGPGQIAAAFSDPDLAVAISERMFSKVIAQMRAWLDAGYEFGHVAVNVSAVEFSQENFAERVLSQLREANVPAEYLELEITETVLLGHEADRADQVLRTLSGAGMRIALDDFGTGFASLTHLQRFPVNTIKIDRSFVKDLDDNRSGAAIVKAVISMGRSMGMAIVAEGIETQAQAEILNMEQCDVGQGYFLGRPVDASTIETVVFGKPAPEADAQSAA